MNTVPPRSKGSTQKFPTGFGQSDTRSPTLSDGWLNPHPKAGMDYATITGSEILALIAKPSARVPKADGQWFIPSTYTRADARSHIAQRTDGQFHWLVLDVDQNNLARSEISQALAEVLGPCRALIYSTSSATHNDRKWRALMPLSEVLSGSDFFETQASFFALLEAHTGGVLTGDKAMQRTGQPVCLPNPQTDFYECQYVTEKRLVLSLEHPVIAWRDADRRARAQAEQQAKDRKAAATTARSAPPTTTDTLPGNVFNERHTVAELLGRYGYTRAGQSNDWRSPKQASGSYATRDLGDYWVSLSNSDAAAGLGVETKAGARFGDAFDLFVHYEHDGNVQAAVATYGQTLRHESHRNAANRSFPTSVPRAATANSFRFIAVGDLEYRSPEFLVDGLIETESLGLIFGDPGSGKTFVAVDICLAVASGLSFHGRKVKQGSVFLLAGEGHSGLARRMAAWSSHHSQSLKSLPLFKSERAAQFLDGASASAVATSIDTLAAVHGTPTLIVIDRLARNFGSGDENNTKDMSEFIVAMDDLRARYPGCSVLIVHHSGHMDKHRARGAMALKGALDVEFRVEKEGYLVKLINTKMKDAEPPARLHFELQSVDLFNGGKSAVLRHTDVHGADDKATPAQRMALTAYKAAAVQHGVWQDGVFQGLHTEEWRRSFYEHHAGKSDETKKKAFQRVRKELVDQGKMVVKDDLYLTHDSTLWEKT